MTMTMKSRLSLLLAAFALFSYGFASAQGYDDDDIYYNPSKAKTQKTTKKTVEEPAVAYPSADSYTPVPGSGRNIDVDAYNRRYMTSSDTASALPQSAAGGDFQYTQQIERFYNPNVIIESPDQEVARVYYSEPTTDVNIYINTPSYWGSSFYSPYTYSSWYYDSPWYWGTPRSWWYYNSWAYNPWNWGPSWSWTWGPSWNWGWGPSWSWGGYYPGHWGHGGYHPARPSWTYRPSGNSRPAYRPGGTASTGGYGNYRPSYRPGTSASSSSGTYNPGHNNSGSSSGSGYRPGRSGTSRSSSSSGYSRPGSSSSSQSSPSYRPRSSRSSSSSSYGGGSRGGSSSGGSRGGGGGRGRH